jgi:DNA-directed RNA polymerase subunit M/transcription elongation factor TFIIS
MTADEARALIESGNMDDLLEVGWLAVEQLEAGFTCAECGTQDAQTYVVTTLITGDSETRTEVCRACDDTIREVRA